MKPNRRCWRLVLPAAAIAAVVLGAGVPGYAKKPGARSLVSDPKGIVDLPAGFTYTIVSRAGDEMDDGLLVPVLCDGMAAFPGPGGSVIVVRNHEGLFSAEGPFGPKNERLSRVRADRLYDSGVAGGACPGGTTTFVWDPKTRAVLRQFLSLGGTVRNCAGGPTPWGSWLSCEENTLNAGTHYEGAVRLAKDHGYVFDVPATIEPALAAPVPLKALGRFYHEGAAVDPRTGVVYQTEDLDDGLFYRFIPDVKGDLSSGRLQALALANHSRDSRNWKKDEARVGVGRKLPVKWIDMDDIDAPKDDLRIRGHDLGACLFARAEGVVEHAGLVYFACTSGGGARTGQIFRYTPSKDEGTAHEKSAPGTLELFVEPDKAHLNSPDNLTVTAAGKLLVCEDPPAGDARLVWVAPNRETRTFAKTRVDSEFAGAAFSPDGSTLFVNLQKPGLTLAIQGPWSGQ